MRAGASPAGCGGRSSTGPSHRTRLLPDPLGPDSGPALYAEAPFREADQEHAAPGTGED
ncbi:hypothetical protein SNL152K_2260 [Streptomyces sp. NL15-2K]|nr:hypothetical protein SNL152K_2260 [Streptomyces sp. NL15-2K]